jgi:hypothetical protein
VNPAQFAQLPPELRTARRFLLDLHPKQQAFVLDKSRRKVAVCSRRAGKSHGILAWLLDGALDDPGGLSVYIARSKGDAMRIMGPAIELYSRLYPALQLKLREIDGQRLLVVGITRHSIWLAGCKDQSEVGKFRGAGNGYKRVAIDEAQEYGAFLRDLITGAIEPALVDKKGQLLLAGTPGPIPAGIFYEVSTGDGGPQWPTHHWTIFDNPHIRDAEEEIRLFCSTYGLDKDSATYRREYLGQWVRDEGALVYPYSANINACRADEVPEGGHLVLSLDFGVVDATAFTILKTLPGAPEVWVLKSWSKTGLIPSAVAAHVEQLIATHGRGMQIVGDEGGLGKGYAEEMRQRYGIGIVAAEKTKKRAFQEIVQGELRSGTIKIVASECYQLIDEMCLLQWAPGKLAEDARFENHCCDSLLYGVRAARAWYRPEREAPTAGTPEWWAAEQTRTRAEMRKRAEQRAKKLGGLRR